jgi:ATP-dependent phosphoenolpyruvate carboxykinase
MIRVVDTRITDEQINALVQAGCKRWTKYGKDRLYIEPEFIGMDVKYYNTGNVSTAYLNGEKISNSYAKKILFALKGSFINVENWRMQTGDNHIYDMIVNAIGEI